MSNLKLFFSVLLGVVCLVLFGIPAFLITLYRMRLQINKYLYMVAISIDELGGCLIYGEKDKTVSYMTGKYILDGNIYAILLGHFIDLLFGKSHCIKEYLKGE